LVPRYSLQNIYHVHRRSVRARALAGRLGGWLSARSLTQAHVVFPRSHSHPSRSRTGGRGSPPGRRASSVRGAPPPNPVDRTHGDRRPSAATQPSHPHSHTHRHPLTVGAVRHRFHSENNLLPSSPRDIHDGVGGRCVMRVCVLPGGGRMASRKGGRRTADVRTNAGGASHQSTHTHTSQRRLISDILFIHTRTHTHTHTDNDVRMRFPSWVIRSSGRRCVCVCVPRPRVTSS